MTKKQLEDLVDKGLSTRQISDELKSSQTNVRYWLNKHGLKTKKRGEPCYKCKYCGESKASEFFMKTGDNRISFSRCKKCHNSRSVQRFRNNKIKAVKYLGGKCLKCGYDKCAGSLHFHHRDPDKKDPNWIRLKNWNFEKIKKELDKCDLLCANCHGEAHWMVSE